MSLRWRLFAAVTVLVWGTIAVMVWYQYDNELEFRKRIVRTEFSNINSRIIMAYEKGEDLPATVDFIGQFYDNTTSNFYQDLRVSVYDDNDSLIASIGKVLPPDHSGTINPDGTTRRDIGADAREKNFYYTAVKSNDGNIQVCAALPFSLTREEAVSVNSNIWILAVLLTLVVTLMTLWVTRFFSRNISLLRSFARRAAAGEPIGDINDLPHDELGDISREIFRIYDERVKAYKQRDHEHSLALHAVEEQARVKRQLTNNINHELKTPIGIIRGYLDTIATTPDMDEATRTHFLERTRNNVERLCNLLNDVATMTRLEEGQESINVGDINFYDLAQNVASDVRESHLAGDMEFKIKIPMDTIVRGNENLLNDMLLNLVKNAANHSHGTEIELEHVSSSSRFHIFTFSDNGVGVAPEHIPHLFERFYRVDKGRSRKVGGTGLGLPIVKNTVVTLGGAISVQNRSTGGLRFTFSLPRGAQ